MGLDLEDLSKSQLLLAIYACLGSCKNMDYIKSRIYCI